MDLNYLNDLPPWDWPAESGEMLRRILRDQSAPASERINAADLAGTLTVMDDKMAELLLSILRRSDEPDDLRAAAAISLGPVLEISDTDGFDDDLADAPIGEDMFHRAQRTLHEVYLDEAVPTTVRRRVLEASVRASQDWHQEAIHTAYAQTDEAWKLTAAFCMQWVPGFNHEILQLLDSPNPEILIEAVSAAGDQEVDEAWPHVVQMLTSNRTEKPLLLAAIGAAGKIRPAEAYSLLEDLADSEDEEIAEAAGEALFDSELYLDGDDEDEDEELLQ